MHLATGALYLESKALMSLICYSSQTVSCILLNTADAPLTSLHTLPDAIQVFTDAADTRVKSMLAKLWRCRFPGVQDIILKGAALLPAVPHHLLVTGMQMQRLGIGCQATQCHVLQ